MYCKDENEEKDAGNGSFFLLKTTLLLNKALWLDVASHMTTSNQSKCFISALHI